MNNKIKKNYIASLIYQIINVLVQVILLRYLSFVIGANGIGIQSYTSSVVLYFTMVSGLGINWLGQKEIAKNLTDKALMSRSFWQLISLKLIWSIGVIFGYILLIQFSETYKIYYVILIITYIANVIDITWLYQGVEQFATIAIRNTFVKVIGMILILVFVKSESDVALYIALTSISLFLGNISLWIGIKRIVYRPVLINMKFKHYIHPAIQYFIPTIATTLYLTMDKTMIGLITKSDYENGFYEQSIQIVNMLKTLVLSYNAVMISRMTYLFATDNIYEAKSHIKTSLQFILYISWGCLFGLLALQQDFVILYFGEGNDKIGEILLVFTPIILVVGISNMIECHLITPLNKRHIGNKIVVIGAVINFIINLILIPIYGAVGAALASVVSEIIIAISYVNYSDNVITWNLIIRMSYKKLVSAIIMYFSICIIKNQFEITYYSFALEILCGLVIYTVILYLFKDEFIQECVKKNKLLCKGEC